MHSPSQWMTLHGHEIFSGANNSGFSNNIQHVQIEGGFISRLNFNQAPLNQCKVIDVIFTTNLDKNSKVHVIEWLALCEIWFMTTTTGEGR